MAKNCVVCGKALGALTSKILISDGVVCRECWAKTGFDASMNTLTEVKNYTSKRVENLIAEKSQMQELIRYFNPTHTVGCLSFDDNSQTFTINLNKNVDLYNYNQILNFELLEDGVSVTKGGLGRAVAGGVLFGGVGAVVGSVTGGKKTSKAVCNSLQIKITLRNSAKQVIYIPFITISTKTNGILYKDAYKNAQETLSALQIATDLASSQTSPVTRAQPTETAKVEEAPALSVTEKLIKLKELCDAGIITTDEFQAKKAELLDLF